MFKLPKPLKYIIISTFILVIIILTFLFYPFLNIKPAIYDKNILETSEIKNSVVIVKDYNPVLPVVATIFKKENPEDQKKGTMVIQTKYNRVSLFKFLPLHTESKQIIIKNKTFQEIQDIVSKYDLTKNNPDPTNIEVECSSNCSKAESKVSIERRMCMTNLSISKKGNFRKVEDIKKLQIGDSLGQVVKILDYPDNNGVSDFDKIIYFIDSDNYAQLSFDGRTVDETLETSKLKSISVYNKDCELKTF